MSERNTDYGALPITITGTKKTRGGHRAEDVVPVGYQRGTKRRVELRLIDQKSGRAEHAFVSDHSLLRAMYNRGMLGDMDGKGRERRDAGEAIQEVYEATGNRQKMGGTYDPVQAQGEPEETESERAASLRYHAIIDVMTHWEWRCVRQVCIDDTMIDGLDIQHLVSGLDAYIQQFVHKG